MNELKVLGRLLAQERGEAVRLTRERPYPLSTRPMALVPIVMAGGSLSLFALGVGDGVGPCRVHVCPEPRNRAEQQAMLGRVAVEMENFLRFWQADPAVMPQVITASRDACRICLVTVHRMTYAPQPELRTVGRRLHWLDRAFERPDSAALLNMPWAICELFATGQDEYADTHLGTLLEWLQPADGQIYERALRAEESSISTSTHPDLDNERLAPLLKALHKAEDTKRAIAANRLRSEIEQIIHNEIECRYRLVREALCKCRCFPASAAADHIQQQDRNRHDRNCAYVTDPKHLVAARLSGDAATAEFLSRELNAEHVEGLIIRSVSGARARARLSGDILAGQVIRRDVQQAGNKVAIYYQIRSSQERLPLRPGDKLTLLDRDIFQFEVVDLALDASGTMVTVELTKGKRKPGQPQVSDYIELVEILGSPERIARAMRLAWDRLRCNPPPLTVQTPLGGARDYLSGIRGLRSTA